MRYLKGETFGWISVMIVAAAVLFRRADCMGQGRPLTPEELMKMKQQFSNQPKPRPESENPLKIVKTLTGHADGVLTVAFSPDGKILASGGGDGEIILWEMASGKQIQSLKAHHGPVMWVDFSSDGKRLVSGGSDTQVMIWNTATGDLEAVWKQACPVNRVAYLPGTDRVVSTCGSNLRLWKIGEDDAVRVMSADDDITCEAVTKEGMVISGDRSGGLAEWNPTTGERLLQKTRSETSVEMAHVSGHPRMNWVQAVHVMKNGDVLLSDVEAMWRWDFKKDEVTFLMDWIPSRIETCDSDKVIVDCDRACLTVHDFAKDYQFQYGAVATMHAISVSPAGDYIALASGGQFDRNWNWIAAGATDVQLFSLPDVLNAVKKAEQKTAKRHATGETGALDPLDHVSNSAVEKTKSIPWK